MKLLFLLVFLLVLLLSEYHCGEDIVVELSGLEFCGKAWKLSEKDDDGDGIDCIVRKGPSKLLIVVDVKPEPKVSSLSLLLVPLLC